MIQVGRNEYSSLGHECVDPYECPICTREMEAEMITELEGYKVLNVSRGVVTLLLYESELYRTEVSVRNGWVEVLEYDKEERTYTDTDFKASSLPVVNAAVKLYNELYVS